MAFAPPDVPQQGGTTAEGIQTWTALDPAPADLKNIGKVELRHVMREGFWFPTVTAEDAREAVRVMENAGRRRKPAR